MIRLKGKYLTWDERNNAALAPLVSSRDLQDRRTPLNPSLLRWAEKRGVKMDSACLVLLGREKQDRILAKTIRNQVDAEAPLYLYANRLFRHQRVAIDYFQLLRQPSYLLADQPGVGKTQVAIAWADRLKADRILVITPNTAKSQWVREIQRWDPRDKSTYIVSGTKSGQAAIVDAANAIKTTAWVIGHWESLRHADVLSAYQSKRWDLIILDEAHALRNRKTKQSKAAASLPATYRLALTAHPIVNEPTDIWGILRFLFPKRYTSFWRFFEEHVLAIETPWGGHDVIGIKDPKRFKWEIAPFTLRRLKRQVFENLPPVARERREVEMPPKHFVEYGKLKSELLVELEGVAAERNVLAIPNVLARLTRLRQHLVDPGLIGSALPSLKYPVVSELLEELDGPPIIFTSFAQAALRLAEFLPGKTDLIYGARTEEQRARAQRRFLKGKLDALIVVTQAGGTALNLGKYGYVIFLDLPWSAMAFEQAEGRVDRPEEGTGRLVPTTSFIISTPMTYEHELMKILSRKQAMFDQIFHSDSLTRVNLERILTP